MQKETPGMAVPGAWGAHMALISFAYNSYIFPLKSLLIDAGITFNRHQTASVLSDVFFGVPGGAHTQIPSKLFAVTVFSRIFCFLFPFL